MTKFRWRAMQNLAMITFVHCVQINFMLFKQMKVELQQVKHAFPLVNAHMMLQYHAQI